MSELASLTKAEQQIVSVAQNKLDPAVESLYNRTSAAPAKNQGGEVISTGQISSMAVPEGWVARGPVNMRAGASLTEFHAPEKENIRLNSFYRGSRISPAAAQTFKNVLAEPPHQLRVSELKTLAPVLGDKAYSNFDVFFAKTMDLNGKRVLSIEGAYKDQAHTGDKTIYVDSDGTGSAVQEISYSATGKNYQTDLAKAENAFKSIVWK